MFVIANVSCLCIYPRPRDQLNAKDADMKKVFISCDVTTKLKVLVKLRFKIHRACLMILEC